jgi:hypothetical protein
VANGPKQFAGPGLGRQLVEQLVDRPEPDRQVLAVIPVAEHGVEARKPRLVAVDNAVALAQGGAHRGSVERGLPGGARRGEVRRRMGLERVADGPGV